MHDVPGVGANAAKVAKKHRVSIAQMRQDEEKEVTPIVFTTHRTTEKAMTKSVEEFSRLSNVISVENVIRVER